MTDLYRCIDCGHGVSEEVKYAAAGCLCCNEFHHCGGCGQPRAGCQCCKSCHSYGKLCPCQPCSYCSIKGCVDHIPCKHCGSVWTKQHAEALGKPWSDFVKPDFSSCVYCNWGQSSAQAPVPKKKVGKGTLDQTPWAERGIIADARNFNGTKEEVFALWNYDPTAICPPEVMCEYYPLQLLSTFSLESHDAYFGYIQREARDLFRQLVAEADKAFIGYVGMAVSGEARHHQAMLAHVSKNRAYAWGGGRQLWNIIGNDYFMDLAILFEDKSWGGGFGGPRWAAPCRLLFQRLTGQIPPALWVDRVFTLQHNGGCLLNKVETFWRKSDIYSLADMANTIGPAHAANPTDWSVLLAGCRPKVASLLKEGFRAINRARREQGIFDRKLSTGPLRPVNRNQLYQDFVALMGEGSETLKRFKLIAAQKGLY